jgi:RNA polymerase-binding transcription factor DksA
MDIKLLSYFKQKLLSVKNMVTSQINRLRKPVDMGSDVESNFDGKTDETEEEVANLGMVETLKRRANRVDDALKKMEQGKYGICEKCNKDIEAPLLEVDPESRYCKACKQAAR